MKFAIVVVMLALAYGAQSSIIPLGAHLPLSYTAVSGPKLLAAAPGAFTYAARDPAFTYAAYAPAITYAAHAPVITYTAHAPAFVAPVVAAEGSYVAKTRGAVHVAPLPGHTSSAASINLEPAAGTN